MDVKNQIKQTCTGSFDYYRDSLAGQLQLALAKADSEQLGRTIAEEQLSDVEKEKTMLELEIKEILSRHKSDLGKKDSVITLVRRLAYFLKNYFLIFSCLPLVSEMDCCRWDIWWGVSEKEVLAL